jgi:hypothetical protein
MVETKRDAANLREAGGLQARAAVMDADSKS